MTDRIEKVLDKYGLYISNRKEPTEFDDFEELSPLNDEDDLAYDLNKVFTDWLEKKVEEAKE